MPLLPHARTHTHTHTHTHTTTGDGVGSNAFFQKAWDIDFLDNNNAIFVDDATVSSCVRKIALPSTPGADATFSRWAGVCTTTLPTATSLPIPTHSSLAYQNYRYKFGRDGVTSGGATPTGILGDGPRALACTPDSTYCYVVTKNEGQHGQQWLYGAFYGDSTHPDTGSTSTHYSTAQIVRIRTSDQYITHLTKIYWRWQRPPLL